MVYVKLKLNWTGEKTKKSIGKYRCRFSDRKYHRNVTGIFGMNYEDMQTETTPHTKNLITKCNILPHSIGHSFLYSHFLHHEH